MIKKWCSVSDLRFEQISSKKDITFCKVFLPYFVDLIKKRNARSILEIGSGTGHLAKEGSRYAEIYTGIEPSRRMVRNSKRLLEGIDNVQIINSKIENADLDRKYELVISHLCFQAIRSLASVLKLIGKAISKNGDLFFSIPHPCFFNEYKKIIPMDKYNYMYPWGGSVDLVITKDKRSIMKVPYFHRPLSEYVKLLKNSGFCIITFDEIYPEYRIQKLYGRVWKAPRYVVFHAKPIRNYISNK